MKKLEGAKEVLSGTTGKVKSFKELDAALDRIARLIWKKAERYEVIFEMVKAFPDFVNGYLDGQKKIDWLIQAVDRYARHRDGCPACDPQTNGGKGGRCSCGFETVIVGVADIDKRRQPAGIGEEL